MWQSGIMKTKKLEYTVIGAGAALLASLACIFFAPSDYNWGVRHGILANTIFLPGVLASISVGEYWADSVGDGWAIGIGMAVGIFTMMVIGGGLGLLIELMFFPHERVMGVPQWVLAHTVFWPGVIAGVCFGIVYVHDIVNFNPGFLVPTMDYTGLAIGVVWYGSFVTMTAIGVIMGLFLWVVRLWRFVKKTRLCPSASQR